MLRKKQLEFMSGGFKKPSDCFGGSLLKNSNAKVSRPLDSKFPVHLVLRTHKSVLRLLKTIKVVDEQVEKICKKHGVRLYQYANVGNHLHLLIKIPRREAWAAFIRELSGRIAQIVREIVGLKGDFWVQRPFTRIVRGWRTAFRRAKDYVRLNGLEAERRIAGSDREFLRILRLQAIRAGWTEVPGSVTNP